MESPAVATHLKARPRPATAGLRYGLRFPSSLLISSLRRRGRIRLRFRADDDTQDAIIDLLAKPAWDRVQSLGR